MSDDDFYTRPILSVRGAKITAMPFAVQWQEGINQFDVEDLDGNVLLFWGDEPAEQTA